MKFPIELSPYLSAREWENLSKMGQLRLVNAVITDLFMVDGELPTANEKKIYALNAVRKLIIADWIKDPKGDD